MANNSPGSSRKAFKLQEFCAHAGAVNCLSLGHKSGRVLATGGDDKKVNLWAVGKPNCILSLSGHTTSIECVRFCGSEELVCAGSSSGALKIWDLEATKIVRTLTGHKSNIRTIDFHPYGDFIGTGSLDTNIKLWDIRRKGCIFTYKGHNAAVNSLKFSPDGQWIASAGEDAMVKLWDLRAGKLLTEFVGHVGPVTDVEFHPHEFLLASASLDRTVNFWDLEKFQQVSSTEPDTGPIRAITFDPAGDLLYAGCPDVLRLYGWEPSRTLDTLAMGWGKVVDLAVANTQLIGAGHHGTYVSLYVVEVRRLQQHFRGAGGASTLTTKGDTPQQDGAPLRGVGSGGESFKHGVGMRKSFSKDKNNAKANAEQMKTEVTSDTGGEEPSDEMHNLNSYSADAFATNRQLQRTHPPELPHWTNNNDPVSVSGEVATSSSNIRQGRRSSTQAVPTPGVTLPSSLLQHRPFTAPKETQHSTSIARDAEDEGAAHRPRAVSESRRTPTLQTNNNTSNRYPLRHSPSEPQLVLEGSALAPQPANFSPPNSLPQLSTPRPPDVTNTSSRSVTSSKPDLTQHPAYRSSIQHNSPDLTRHSSTTTPASSYNISTVSPYHHTSHTDLSVTAQRAAVLSSSSQFTTSQQNTRNAYNSRDFARQVSQPHEITYMGTPKDDLRASQPNISYMGSPKDLSAYSSKYSNRDDLLPEKGPMNAFDDCLPNKLGGLTFGAEHVVTLNAMSEQDVLGHIAKGHTAMLGALVGRARLLRSAYTLWQSKDLRSALEHTLNAADQSSLLDLLNIINMRPSIWNLDIVTALLPSVSQLLQSKHESYVTVGCNCLKLMLKNFGSMIKSNMQGPVHSVGVDISREERRNKCIESFNMMMSIRALVQKRQTLSGSLGHTYRELYILMQVFDE